MTLDAETSEPYHTLDEALEREIADAWGRLREAARVDSLAAPKVVNPTMWAPSIRPSARVRVPSQTATPWP